VPRPQRITSAGIWRQLDWRPSLDRGRSRSIAAALGPLQGGLASNGRDGEREQIGCQRASATAELIRSDELAAGPAAKRRSCGAQQRQMGRSLAGSWSLTAAGRYPSSPAPRAPPGRRPGLGLAWCWSWPSWSCWEAYLYSWSGNQCLSADGAPGFPLGPTRGQRLQLALGPPAMARPGGELIRR